MEGAQVTILNSTNYRSWKDEIQVVLMEKGAWGFVDGSEPPLPATASHRDLTDYNLRRNRSYTTIFLSISEEYRTLISETKDGATAWNILADVFEPKSRCRIVQLLDNFFSTKYLPGETMAIFLARLKVAIRDLKDAGHPVEGVYQAFQAIRYLPTPYQNLVQGIYRWEDSKFTLLNIEKELILEEHRIAQSTKDLESINLSDTYSSALGASSSKRTAIKPKPAADTSIKKIGPCYRCHNFGHLISDCQLKVQKPKVNLGKRSQKFKGKNQSGQLLEELPIVEQGERKLSVKGEVLSSGTNGRTDKFSWVIDTGATSHFCNNISLFSDYRTIKDTKLSVALDNVQCHIEGIGVVKFFVTLKGQPREITLTNVLYSKNLRRNLISGSVMETKKYKFIGANGKISVFNPKGEEIFYGVRKNGLYIVKPQYILKEKNISCKPSMSVRKHKKTESFNIENLNLEVWHKRFSHINCKYISHTSKSSSVRGMPVFDKSEIDCEACKIAKGKRKTFKSIPGIRSKRPLELLHMDVCGPLPVDSLNQKRYFLTITDDFSRKVVVFPMKNKSEVFDLFLRFQKRAERFLNTKIVNIRTDNGMEFCHTDFCTFLEKMGIKAERTNVYSPQMNGVSERFNYTCLDAVKALLKDSHLEQKFWAEALNCFVYVWNRVCHQNNSKTPFELYSGKQPSVAHLRVFGCLAFVGIPKQKRKKLDMRSKVGIMLGYAWNTRGYRIWLPDEKKVIETSNVKFDENKIGVEAVLGPIKRKVFFKKSDDYFLNSDSDEQSCTEIKDEVESPEISSKESEHSGESSGESVEILESVEPDLAPCDSINWIRQGVPRKTGKRVDIYYTVEGTNSRFRSLKDIEAYCRARKIKFDGSMFNFSTTDKSRGRVNFQHEANHIEVYVPESYREIFKTPEVKDWQQAMEKEIEIMKSREVWDLVPRMPDQKVLGNRWVYNLKTNEDNKIVRFKARLVAQGFRQIKGESYEDVFSPVVNFTLIRMFFTIFVCLLKWCHFQLDINSAYLYAHLNQDIFMFQPQGFVNPKLKTHVCKLRKAIYGLHQSGREWFFELHSVLEDLNFRKLNWCNCCYILGNDVILIVYVDDIILFGRNQININFVVNLLKTKFDIKELGKTKKLLGIEFEELNGELFIHQNSYIEKVCRHYEKFHFPLSSLPIVKGCVLTKLDCPSSKNETTIMSKLPYRNILGCLAFLANRTRPDISYSVNILSQFQENPGQKHFDCLLKLLGYVKTTQNYKLRLSNVTECKLLCFSDSDFAANRDDRISMGGMIALLDRVPISWRTFKHKSVSLSTMEAEYVTLTEASKELVWLKNVLTECQHLTPEISDFILFCDNLAAIDFSKSPVENHRTKHIDIKYHFLRNLVYENTFNLKFCKSENNLADVFTKPQTKCQLEKFCKLIFQM